MNGEGTTRDGTHSSEHVLTRATVSEHHRPAANMRCAKTMRNICLPYRIRLDAPRYKGGLIEIGPYNAWFTRVQRRADLRYAPNGNLICMIHPMRT